jgi:hypothetical protein
MEPTLIRSRVPCSPPMGLPVDGLHGVHDPSKIPTFFAGRACSTDLPNVGFQIPSIGTS